MVLCLGFLSSLRTDLRIIPQFSATQQLELSPPLLRAQLYFSTFFSTLRHTILRAQAVTVTMIPTCLWGCGGLQASCLSDVGVDREAPVLALDVLRSGPQQS